MTNRRPLFMVLVGSAVFLVGAALVLVSLQSRPASAAGRRVAAPASTPTGTGNASVPPSEVGVASGHQAVAVTTPSPAAGLAAYLGPGDLVDVYATITRLSSPGGPGPSGPSTGAQIPCTVLVAADVPVLDVSVQLPEYKGHPSSAGRQPPTAMTVLLSATTAEAPALVFAAGNESIYLTEVTAAPAPAAARTCVGTGQVLAGGGR